MTDTPKPVQSYSLSTGFLLSIAFIGALIGLASLSNATMGVGFLAASCLLAIVARIAQAGAHHRDMMSKP